jgi:hypothetical protein
MGCGAERAPAQAAEEIAVVTDDPELRALAETLLPDLARRSGLEVRAPIHLERRSRAALVEYLEAKLDADLPPARAERLETAYTLLGLAPAEFDLRSTLLAVYTEQVAGFYDPDSTTLYVLDDQPRAVLEPLLLHELVHAVQDQWIDLEAATAMELGNDRRVAALAAIEGHATFVMLEHTLAEMGGASDLTQVDDFAALVGPALAGARDQYPVLAAAPRVIQESLLLPYLSGAGFVHSVWRARGARTGDFERLIPTSTEQVGQPERFLSTPPDAPTEVRLEVRGVRPLLDDVLGYAETRILLEELVGPAAGVAANGWDGDRWVLVEGEEAARGLVWVAVFDTLAARDRFVATLTPRLDAFPARATLGSMAVDGRPVVMLRIGVQPEVTISLEGGA